MIAKAIGYLIGAVFVGLLLAPIPLAVWFVYDGTTVLMSTSVADAVIERCDRRSTRGIKSRGIASHVSWVPVAKTASGVEIKGDFGWTRRSWCESDVGKRVSVFVHDTNRSMNRINTFSQFWFFPMILTAICVLYLCIYIIKRKRRRGVPARPR